MRAMRDVASKFDASCGNCFDGSLGIHFASILKRKLRAKLKGCNLKDTLPYSYVASEQNEYIKVHVYYKKIANTSKHEN